MAFFGLFGDKETPVDPVYGKMEQDWKKAGMDGAIKSSMRVAGNDIRNYKQAQATPPGSVVAPNSATPKVVKTNVPSFKSWKAELKAKAELDKPVTPSVMNDAMKSSLATGAADLANFRQQQTSDTAMDRAIKSSLATGKQDMAKQATRAGLVARDITKTVDQVGALQDIYDRYLDVKTGGKNNRTNQVMQERIFPGLRNFPGASRFQFVPHSSNINVRREGNSAYYQGASQSEPAAIYMPDSPAASDSLIFRHEVAHSQQPRITADEKIGLTSNSKSNPVTGDYANTYMSDIESSPRLKREQDAWNRAGIPTHNISRIRAMQQNRANLTAKMLKAINAQYANSMARM
jgi:hypothetical protein